MTHPFDDLFLLNGQDGASTPVGLLRPQDEAEIDEIMDAWFQERHDNIESGIFLDQARRLLVRILAEGELTPRTRRRAKRLIRAIGARVGEEPQM
jgi:hypothetical protein